MQDTSKEIPNQKRLTIMRWFFGYLLPGFFLIVLGFIAASVSPADAIGLGGFLCFFVMGVTMMIEGTKRWLAAPQRNAERTTDETYR